MSTKIYLSDTDDPIDIRYDNVFKAVFTQETPESKGALSKLVSAFIGREVSIVTITINEPPIENLRDRRMRFDINCRAENGERVNVEMSFNPAPFEPVRLEFYTGKLFVGQNISGTEKTYDDLKETYQISILANEKFFKDEVFFHSFEYYDPVNKVSLNGRTRIITLELAKVEKIVEKPTEEMSVHELWAVFFEYLTDKDKRCKINEILEQEEGIAMASEVLMTISKNEIEQARLLSELKYELDTKSRIVHAANTATKTATETVARNALAEGLSLEIIQKITGLDVETIMSLK
jgi:predicted transposase/invertase (TIGR01784 family)